ncbi:putative odorant receptor 92a [Pieris rapae]|uniref:putative odorant receptor 92a n=1 Tax=Pieris rapae TaxID=64459 RepID=UPI001E27E4D9|nr:putative odorant receptor 92a [Pieris rapae]
MSDLNLIFYKQFKITTMAMRFNRSWPYGKRSILCKIQVFVSYFVSIVTLFFLLYSMIFYDFPDEEYGEVVKNGIIVIVSTSVIIKFFILTHHRESLVNLIKIVQNDYEEAKQFNINDKTIILDYAQKGKDICKIWIVIAAGASMMFPIKAIVLMAYYTYKEEFKLVPIFDMHYPDVINAHKYEPKIYILLFLLIFPFDCFAGTMYVAFDPLVPIFMLHMCGQLQLLSQRITRLFSQNEADIKDNLRIINIKLQSIYSFLETVQNIFTVQYEYNLKTTTFLIPFAFFQIIQSLKNREFNLEFVFFFVGAILHFYIPCYYSDMLMEKSGKMREAIYSSGWEHNANIKSRKMILFMLTRTTMPLVIRTIFYPICLDTFAKMTRHSYTIYNLMNAAWG